jgi:Zn finger protein HypA/HybF involved in hydrogenase expression
MSEQSTGGVEQGDVSVSNLVCSCKDGGQVMEKGQLGGYECPNCGQTAEVIVRWNTDTDR